MSNKRDGHKGFHHYLPPVQSINNHQRIYKFLCDHVKGQDTSLNGLASTLSHLLRPHTERKVYRATLGGASGSGKTTTVETIRHLLGMDPGYPYANQFVTINGNAVSDDIAKAGGKEGLTLLKRLKNATQTTKSLDTGKKETLPYLCLFVENVEKASAKFIDCVGPLFECGSYSIPGSSESFSIPKKTPLLVLFTTNAASTRIAAMEKPDDSVAAEMIRLTLKERWPDGNLLKRMEPIYPFYILKAATLKPILMEKFEEYVRDVDIRNRFEGGMIQYNTDVKQMIVDHVVAKVNTSHGIQGSISQLIRKLDIFFSAGLGALDSMLSDNTKHLVSPIVVTTHSIDIQRFQESLNQQLENVVKELRQQSSVISSENTLSVHNVIDSILENPENNQFVAAFDPTQEGKVNAVAMAYGNVSLCSLVMNITYNNYQVINHMDQEEEVRHLKHKLRRYKNDLKEVIQTIDRSSTESSFHSTMRQIADAKRKLIESSSGSSSTSSDDETDYNRKAGRLMASPRHPSLLPMVKKRSPVRSVEEEPLHKRVKLTESDLMLDYSDEIDLYIGGASDEDNLFGDTDEEDDSLSDILSIEECSQAQPQQDLTDVLIQKHSPSKKKKKKKREKQEPEGMDVIVACQESRACIRCGHQRPMASFVRKRADCKRGFSVSSVCASCRK